MKSSIYITRPAYNRIRAIVQASNLEVSMLGEVEIKDKNVIITEIHIPRQTRSAAFTEIVHDGISELLESGVDPSKVKCWIHSHVNMGVSPSGQDVSQAKELMKDSDWFIRGIFNKKNEYTLSLHWNNLIVDCELLILEDNVEDIEAIKREIEEKTVVRQVSNELAKPRRAFYTEYLRDQEDIFEETYVGGKKRKISYEQFRERFGVDVPMKEIHAKWVAYLGNFQG